MVDMIRCPSCRGSKKVTKLGGMLGDCNTCKGKGEILESDKPAPIVIPVAQPKLDIAAQVADCVPGSISLTNTTTDTVKDSALLKQAQIQKPSDDEKKRNIYKRKKA